jgi:outer membrane protein OmpA-like peptidoglycan-associated protein
LNLDLRLGGGLLSWKVKDASADAVIKVPGPHTEPVEFKANEVFVSGGAGMSITLSSRLALELAFQADYLSGAGAEFASQINDERGRWLYNGIIGLNFSFGFGRPTLLPSDTKTSQLVPVRTLGSGRLSDGDGDGVVNARDKCPNTPIGSIVDENGCAIDSDGDGVSDGLDHCPRTNYRARGLVDIYGCPIDSDFDGVVDYLDNCPHGAVGAVVDSSGCPVDSDADGVPDGLDDCPNTLYGVDVDRNGCIDLAMLAEPMVLNIDYTPGSFEVDPANLERLRRLARLLNFVPNIKLEITGYTDNIGTTRANRRLSMKRANRVRLYLSTMGVDEERIKTFGRGEVDFVASNQTAEGRARNRRISIVFHQ